MSLIFRSFVVFKIHKLHVSMEMCQQKRVHFVKIQLGNCQVRTVLKETITLLFASELTSFEDLKSMKFGLCSLLGYDAV
jgi:hypothetical protein